MTAAGQSSATLVKISSYYLYDAGSMLNKNFQLLGPADMAELAQGLGFNLAD